MEDELVVIRVTELKQLIKEAVRQELNNGKHFAIPEEVLTSDEVIKMLKISKGFLPTLRKNGLPYYALGDGSAALRYTRNEILEYMKTLKK